MNTPVAAAPPDRHAAYNKGRLFVVSVLALFTAGLAASLRASVATDLQRIFFDPRPFAAGFRLDDGPAVR